MMLLVILIVAPLVFLFMFERACRAGYGWLLFWLVWTVGGICLLLAIPNEYNSLATVGVWLLMVVMFGVPVWRVVAWILPRREPRPPRENYTDLKPIVDEQGKQIFP